MPIYVIVFKSALQKIQGSVLIKRLRSRSGLSNDWRTKTTAITAAEIRRERLFIDLVGSVTSDDKV